MKVNITYPIISLNTAEFEIPDGTDINKLSQEEIRDLLLSADTDHLGTFDEPNKALIRDAIDSDINQLWIHPIEQ